MIDINGDARGVRPIGRVLLACSLFAIAFAPQANADTIYTYTGNPFTTVFLIPPPETTSDSITGSFSLAAPLAPNLSNALIELNGVGSLISFNFSDGVFTYGLTSGGGATVLVSTDSTGQIAQWAVSSGVCCPTPPVFATQNGLSNGYNVFGNFIIDVAGTAYNTTFIFNTAMPGTWTASTTAPSVVPEPSSLLLLGTGLLGVVGAVRRKWRG